MKILVIHGPNLNLLGVREPEVYGSVTMEEINKGLKERASSHNIEVEAFQSNAEHKIVTKLQDSMNQIDFIIINPGALTHTSIAIRDEFRHKSYFSDIANGVICGLGTQGYDLALRHIIDNYKGGK